MRLLMNVNSAQLDSMAVNANTAVGVAMLRKALDTNTGAVTQLLDSLPQKDGAGKLIDVQM